MQIQKWLLFGAIAALAGAAGIYVSNDRHSPAPLTDSAQDSAVAQLMRLQLPDATGKTMALNTYQGKTLIVNFWAPWCPPCVEEMPELVQLQSEFASKNVQFLGIGIDSAANISKFNEKIKTNYPLLVAGYDGTQLAKALGNAQGGLPFTVMIGADGRILQRKMGRIQAEELRSWLK